MSDKDFASSLRELGTQKPTSRLKLGWTFLSIFCFAFIVLVSQKFFLAPMIAVTATIILHEFGHCLSMYLFGYQNTSLYLIPLFGGLAVGSKHAPPAWQSAIVLFAGPLPGLVIGTAVWMSLPNELVVVTPNILPFQTLLLYDSAMFLVLLNAINLLPILPLDGGRIFQLLIRGKRVELSMIFTIVSVAAFVAVTVANHQWVLTLFALLFLCTLPGKIRLSRSATQIRPQLAGIASELSNISDEHANVLCLAARSMMSRELSIFPRDDNEFNEHLLQTAKELHEFLVTRPLSRISTAIVLIVYLLAWMLPLVCSLNPKPIRYVTNYPSP